MPVPILYSFRRCPYAMRARLALAVSETRCELREVKLAAKPSAMLEASPKGTVPVLVLPGGEVIDESLDIMRYALSRNDPEAWLANDDPDLIAGNDGPFKHHLDRYKYPERHGSDPLIHREHAMNFLRQVEDRLTMSPHLAGKGRGMVDAAVAPFVRQFAAVAPLWFEEQKLPRLQGWLADFLASELFRAVMIRPRPWTPEQPPLFFP
jgi:glutathione S-transferase